MTALAVAIIALALAAADGAMLIGLWKFQDHETYTALLDESSAVRAMNLSARDPYAEPGQVIDLPAETPAGVAVEAAIVDSTGVVVAHSPEHPLTTSELGALARATPRDGQHWVQISDQHGTQRSVYAQGIGEYGTDVLIVSRSLAEPRRTLAATALLLALVSVILVAMGGALSWLLAHRVLRPVHTIAGLARSISDQDLNRRVDVKAPDDELGELVTTFNEMLGRLEGSFTSMRGFTADASHELRAPVALMRSEVERILSRPRSEDEYREVLQQIRADTEHMAQVVGQLLMLARADAGALQRVCEPVDVADFLYEAAARWERMAGAKDVTIEVEAPDSGSMSADPPLIRRVVDNLLDNAIRHTAPSTSVGLRAYRISAGWAIEVSDHGPGIPAGFRPRLGARFARAEGSRSREGGGAGLGLALCAAIAEAHGGSLELVDGDGPGAVFRFQLPDQPSSP